MTKSPHRAVPISKAPEPARGSLTIRLRKEVRREIEAAAVKYGRSLSEEIESRLENSLSLKHYIKQEWGDDWFIIAQAAASSLSQIENLQGRVWTEDDETAKLFALTVQELIRNYRDHIVKAKGRTTPIGRFEDKTREELAQMFAALGGLAPPRPKSKKSAVFEEEE